MYAQGHPVPAALPLCIHRDILYLKTCHYAHTVCMAGSRWQAAVQYGETVLPWFKRYYGPQAGVVAGLLARLGEAQVGSSRRGNKEWKKVVVAGCAGFHQ